VGPTDLREAEALVARLRGLGANRFAIVFDREIYGRELAGQVVTLARADGLRPVEAEEYRGQVDEIPGLVRDVAEDRPDAVVQLGVAGRGTIPMLLAIDDQLPGVPLLGASGMLAIRGLALPPGPEQIEAVGPALPPERAGYGRCGSCSTRWPRAGATAAG
jgi:ABC-type branched-subunit amino acid transport system substrate-binding protein